MDQTEYLCLDDPVQNFKIRVILRCLKNYNTNNTVRQAYNEHNKEKDYKDIVHVNLSNDELNSSSGNDMECWDETFSWQEKKFGPRELESYVHSNDHLSHEETHREYQDQIQTSIDDKKLIRNISEVMLFTYTDKENFIPMNELYEDVTTSENFSLNNVAKSIALIPKTGGLINNQYSYRNNTSSMESWRDSELGRQGNIPNRTFYPSSGQRLFRQTSHKYFYIMAALDLDTGKLQALRQALYNKNEIPSDSLGQGRYLEVVLCKITITNNGKMMEMTPKFTHYKPFWVEKEDSTAHGPLQINTWYKFKTPMGRTYEYALINEKGNPSKTQIKKLNDLHWNTFTEKIKALEPIYERIYNRPKHYLQQIHHVGLEIVSALDFEDAASNHLYVQYELILPASSQWNWQSSSVPDHVYKGTSDSDRNYPLRGVTQTCQQRFVTYWFNGSSTQDLSEHLHQLTRNDERRKRLAAHFCFPIDVQMQATRQHETDNIYDMPKLFLHVKSIDMFKRHRSEGYAYLDLPKQAGFHDYELQAWKVAGSLREKEKDFYIGGATNLESTMYTCIPDTHSGPFLNRYGFNSVTTGTVRVRVSSVIHIFVDPFLTAMLNSKEKSQRLNGVACPTKKWNHENDISTSSSTAKQIRRHTVEDILTRLKKDKSNSVSHIEP